MCGELDLGKFACCQLRMIAFLVRCLSTDAKSLVLVRRSIHLTGSVANHWHFLSRSAASAFISIRVEHLRNCRRVSPSILQFWVWPLQIHARDCLARSHGY